MAKTFREKLEYFDERVIYFFREYSDELARAAFFMIFFWFGVLKIFHLSAAGPLVNELLDSTFLSVIPNDAFMVAFGLFEMLIGTMALVPRLERFTFALLGFHLITTMMPLFILTEITWAHAFTPTLTGQYIMKNVALLALGTALFARLQPMKETHSFWSFENDPYK